MTITLICYTMSNIVQQMTLFKIIMFSYGVINTINKPASITDSSATLTDNIFLKGQSLDRYFIIYINDIVNSSKLLQFVLFADDTNLFAFHVNLNALISLINTELIKSQTG